MRNGKHVCAFKAGSTHQRNPSIALHSKDQSRASFHNVESWMTNRAIFVKLKNAYPQRTRDSVFH